VNFKITVPYRRYRYQGKRTAFNGFELVVTKEYKRLMKLIKKYDNIKFVHEIVATDNWRDGTWYDKVTVEIND